MDVAAIPPRYAATAIPYLTVPSGAEALAFYASAFGAVEQFRLTAPDGTVVHAELVIGEALLMLSSAMPQMNFFPAAHYGGTPITVSVYVQDVDRFAAHAVEAGCTMVRPPEDQFYGDRSATLTDPFGLRWMFGTHVEDVTPDEMQTRMNRMFAPQG